MNIVLNTMYCIAILVFTCAFSTKCAALDEQANDTNAYPAFHIYSAQNEFGWNMEKHDFTKSAPVAIIPHVEDDEQSNAAPEIKKPPKKREKMVDRVLKKIPFGKDLKSTWKVIDGDIDVMNVENLRLDRKNMGVSYSTNTIPMIGDVDHVNFKFEGGQENRATFESTALPYMGHIDGLKIRASAGDDSRVSFRYKIKLK